MLNTIFLIHNEKHITFRDFRKTVKSQMTYLQNNNISKAVLLGDDTYIFLVNLFACIYSNIPVVLIPDKTKLKYTDGILLDIVNEDLELSPIKGINSSYVIEFLTSGSTGIPKTIKKTLKNLIEEAKDIKKTFDFSQVSEFMTSSTLAHLFGFTFCLMTPFVSRKPINVRRVSFPEQIKTENVAFISTPAFLSRMVKYSIMPEHPLALIISAGAKLEDKDFEYLESKTEVIEIYGSTETGVIAHRETSKTKLKLFENVQIYADKIKTPYMFEDELELLDTIKFLPDGIIIEARKDRILKIKEERVSVSEIESVINQSGMVSDSYCLKIDDKLACVGVVSNPQDFIAKGSKEFTKDLKHYLKDKVNIVPQKWKFVSEIPKNAQGKTDVDYIKSLFDINLSYPFVLSENQDELKLVFHRDSNFFKGHFDEYPIVPGVVQLYYAAFFAKKLFGENVDAGQLKKIKFSNLIIPDKAINLSLTKSEKYVMYKYFDDDKVYSSGQLPINNIFKVQA